MKLEACGGAVFRRQARRREGVLLYSIAVAAERDELRLIQVFSNAARAELCASSMINLNRECSKSQYALRERRETFCANAA